NVGKSVTIVDMGNIMKCTEAELRDSGYDIARQYFGAEKNDGNHWSKIPMGKPGGGIVIKDAIADITLQQVLTRPEDFDVIATLNLNGDYLSDALAAQVGGIGIAPGGNINYITGHAVFEATHGTAPKYAGQDKVNPGSVILSGEMMLRHLGWNEAADLVVKGMDVDIADQKAAGVALDMLESGPITGSDSRVIGGSDYAQTANSDVVVITSGVPRKPGMSRDDLLNVNFGIMKAVTAEVVKHSPNCIIVPVANPLDAMCQAVYRLSGFPRERVIGMAGVLDSARMRTFIAMELNVSVESVHAFV